MNLILRQTKAAALSLCLCSLVVVQNQTVAQTQSTVKTVQSHSVSSFNPEALRNGIKIKWIGGLLCIGGALAIAPPVMLVGSTVGLVGVIVQDVQISRLADAHNSTPFVPRSTNRVSSSSVANQVAQDMVPFDPNSTNRASSSSAANQVAQDMGLVPVGTPQKMQEVFVVVNGLLMPGECVAPGSEFSKIYFPGLSRSKRIGNKHILISPTTEGE